MQKTATLENLNQNNFAMLLEMLRSLLEQGIIDRTTADTTAQRIASENELTPIYLW